MTVQRKRIYKQNKNNVNHYKILSRLKGFRNDSKIAAVENFINPDPSTGVSKYVAVKDIEEAVGFKITGNGSPILQSDRGIGIKYKIEKIYSGDGVFSLKYVRTVGFNTQTKLKIAKDIRKHFKDKPCVMCTTHNNTILDHKNPRKSLSSSTEDFQVLCKHCNTIKRERCKQCISTGKRFDAKKLGYVVSWVKGGKYYDPNGLKCKGCYLYDPIEFNKIVSK